VSPGRFFLKYPLTTINDQGRLSCSKRLFTANVYHLS
jgi:hypothetical protein